MRVHLAIHSAQDGPYVPLFGKLLRVQRIGEFQTPLHASHRAAARIYVLARCKKESKSITQFDNEGIRLRTTTGI